MPRNRSRWNGLRNKNINTKNFALSKDTLMNKCVLKLSFFDEEFSFVLRHVNKVVGRVDQSRRCRFLKGHDFHLATEAVFKVVDEWDIVAITGHENDGIEFVAHLNPVDRDANVPISFFSPAREHLQFFHPHLKTDFAQCLKKVFLFSGL